MLPCVHAAARPALIEYGIAKGQLQLQATGFQERLDGAQKIGRVMSWVLRQVNDEEQHVRAKNDAMSGAFANAPEM